MYDAVSPFCILLFLQTQYSGSLLPQSCMPAVRLLPKNMVELLRFPASTKHAGREFIGRIPKGQGPLPPSPPSSFVFGYFFTVIITPLGLVSLPTCIELCEYTNIVSREWLLPMRFGFHTTQSDEKCNLTTLSLMDELTVVLSFSKRYNRV